MPVTINLVVTSPRDDAVLQAQRLMTEISGTKHLVLNMTKSLADRAESGVAVTLPYNEGWAQSADSRLADPLLSLVYSGWNRRDKMNRTTQFVIGLLAVLLAIVAGVYGRNFYLKEVSTYQIPVPVADIPPYTVLNESMFQMRDMPRTMEALPYYQSLADLEGPNFRHEALLVCLFPKPVRFHLNQFRLADAAFEVVSIPVDPVSAVGGQIRIGQRVNLYQMVKENSSNAEQTTTRETESDIQVEQIANKVLVVDVRTSQGVSAGPTNEESKSRWQSDFRQPSRLNRYRS